MRRFLTDDEYRDYFFVLGGMRRALAEDLARHLGASSKSVLDLASGHGLFGLELAHAMPQAVVCLTGLGLDRDSFRELASSLESGRVSRLPHLVPADLDRLEYVVSDVRSLPFRDQSFDASANFLGLEDVHMIGGHSAVSSTIREIARVTKPGGWVEIAVQIFGDQPEDRLARDIMASIGHGAIFLDPEAYETMLTQAGAQVVERRVYSSRAILTASQAKEELRYACVETPRVYERHGVRTEGLDEIWARFGNAIAEHGYALYADVLAILGRRLEQESG